MTLPNNPVTASTGVPQPSEAPAGTSSLPAPMSAPVMVAPVADPYGAAPLYAGPSDTARSSRSMRGRIAAWMVIVLQAISLVHGFIPYDFEHLDAYTRTLSNPVFWFWRLMFIIVIALAVLYLHKGAVIARYVAACIILVLFFIVTPVMRIVHDVVWYYAFVPDPRLYELGAVSARVLLMQVLDWFCVIAAILLAIPDFKPAPSPYAMSPAVPAAGAAPVGYYPHAAAPAQTVSPQGAPMQVSPTQPASPQGMPVQTSSPTLAPPSGAPVVPGTPDDSASAPQ